MPYKKMFLIDGSAIFYRSYFAFIRNPLINSKGENTSATFGFLSTVFKLIETEKPDYFCVVFDTKEPTFRHKMYTEYKATREKMPDDMRESYPRMRQALETLNLNILEMDGYEADDIIATISRSLATDDLRVYIVSGDKDLAQLVNDNVFIYTPARTGSNLPEVLGRDEIKEKYGVFPEQIVDWLALIGDKSDNVPGIPSVGPKTAVNLLSEYDTLSDVLKNVDAISKNNLREKIKEYHDTALLSQKLVVLEYQVPINFDLDSLCLRSWEQQEIEVLLKDMEFNNLIKRAAAVHQLISDKDEETVVQKPQKEAAYHLVSEKSAFDALLSRWETVDEFVFDLETDSLDTFTAKIAGIAVAFSENEAYYISLNHTDSVLDEKSVLEKLKPIFEDFKVKKAGQNIKFDTMILRRHGINPENISFDTMVASFLINSTTSQHNMDTLAGEYLGYKTIKIEEIIGEGKNQKKMTDLPSDMVYWYACEDADITLRLKNVLAPKLKELDLEDLFYMVEMPLIPVLIEMEERGVELDTSLLSKLSAELSESLQKLQNEIYTLATEEFNINSPQQLGIILFDKLEIHKEIEMRKPKRTKTGQYSTSEQILERYHRHPLPRAILEYRKLNKLKNTYVDALPGLIRPLTGRVHTSFMQTIAATGRLSSVNPNLQNIPIRTELGREMRRAFTSRADNVYILSADYSQIELRLMAHLSNDTAMLESFRNDQDIHVATAARVLAIDMSEVDEEDRRKAKAINFGIIYGMSKYGLSNRLDISVDEAEMFIAEYFATYPGIKEYMSKTVREATANGYVRTMKGRIRYLPQIHSSNRQLREFAERTSINTPIQGSAADLIKMAMIDIHRAITKEGLQSKMILQVHDELVFEVPQNEIDRLKDLVREKMENAMDLKIPVKVDVGTGKNWLEAH